MTVKIRKKWYLRPVEKVKPSKKLYGRKINRDAVKRALDEMEKYN